MLAGGGDGRGDLWHECQLDRKSLVCGNGVEGAGRGFEGGGGGNDSSNLIGRSEILKRDGLKEVQIIVISNLF